MTQLAQYDTSEAHDVLYRLAKKHRVICLIGPHDNVGMTNYSEYYPDRITILSIGYCFISAENQKQFCEQCEKMKVRWLVPSSWVHIRHNFDEAYDDD